MDYTVLDVFMFALAAGAVSCVIVEIVAEAVTQIRKIFRP